MGSSVLFLPFAQYPQLQQPGGSVLTTTSGYSDPVCGLNGIIVVNTSAGTYAALQSACTHACCTVCFNGTQLFCSCHGGVFNVTTGQRLAGPAAPAMQVLQTCTDSTGVYVTL